MQIIHGEQLQLITGRTHRKQQEQWFVEQGITYKVNARGIVYTTDDWMNGKDKYQVAQNDDGFNLAGLERNAS